MADDELTGRLLVATHDLGERTFRHSVVLVLSHDATHGAAGVILNRPTAMAPPGALARWAAHSSTPAVLFRGGPVSPDAVIGVALAAHVGRAREVGWQPITGRIGVVDLARDPTIAAPHLHGARMFAGYAGWSPGQLEGEIVSGAWFVVPADPSDAVTTAPDTLWRCVLARQGGLFTTVPVDPALN